MSEDFDQRYEKMHALEQFSNNANLEAEVVRLASLLFGIDRAEAIAKLEASGKLLLRESRIRGDIDLLKDSGHTNAPAYEHLQKSLAEITEQYAGYNGLVGLNSYYIHKRILSGFYRLGQVNGLMVWEHQPVR